MLYINCYDIIMADAARAGPHCKWFHTSKPEQRNNISLSLYIYIYTY